MLPLILVNRMYIEYFFQLNNTTTFLSDEILKLVLYMPCLVVKHISSKYLLLITLFWDEGSNHWCFMIEVTYIQNYLQTEKVSVKNTCL